MGEGHLDKIAANLETWRNRNLATFVEIAHLSNITERCEALRVVENSSFEFYWNNLTSIIIYESCFPI
ncbi:hypothetical protein RAS2_07170 [Phycisphaerae bacterium RAS2]|nr:hypothetical protein RAS2_07170 [Phycisphaerae bacterium RAS2]